MLRASAKRTGTPLDLRGVAHDNVDPLIPWGVELRAFTTAMVTGDDIDAARAVLTHVSSPATTVSAAAVCGNFQMMNRILDATGCPVPPAVHTMAERLGVEIPEGVHD